MIQVKEKDLKLLMLTDTIFKKLKVQEILFPWQVTFKLNRILTLFYCDSAVLNQAANTIEAFGNIHINDADSVHTYSQYLKYLGKEKIAYLKKKVKLTDRKLF